MYGVCIKELKGNACQQYMYIYRERALEEERLHYKVIEKKKPFENQREKKNKLNITEDKTNMY